MLRENYIAKQRRIGERLSRAMVKAHTVGRSRAARTAIMGSRITEAITPATRHTSKSTMSIMSYGYYGQSYGAGF